MNLIISIVAALAGILLFSSHSHVLLGTIFGAALALSWRQLSSLRSRVADLERQLSQSSVAQPTPKPVTDAAPVRDPFADSGFSSVSDPEFEPVLESEAVQPFAAEQTHGGGTAAAARPVPPSRPQPNRAEAPGRQVELWNIVVAYFTGGNVVVRAGVVVLFFGVAFLLKYSAERNLVPIEFRLFGVAAGALVLLVCGWRLRLRRTGYALILQGGAIGVLYLTIFAALRLYQLLPTGLALILLIGMSVFSATLAILQDARALAVIGILGGFLAPVLTSTGGGSHVMLFSYYALLNVGILLVARHRTWRELNLLGFVFTFGIGTLWGSNSYRPELFATTEPFLLLFFLFYLTIGVLFARNLPLPQKGYIDGTMVFGTPIVCFALQAQLVKPFEYGLAWSALGVGLIYAVLAWALFKKGTAAMRTMVESFLALGIVFATVAIPLALDGRWTATAWALEGSAIVWIAIRQQRWLPRLFGLVLQPLAGAAFILDAGLPSARLAVFNSFFLGCLVISLAGFFSGLCLDRGRDRIASGSLESRLMLVWALLWWFGAGIHEIDRFAPEPYQLALLLILLSISCVTAYWEGCRLRWIDLSQLYLGLLAGMLAGAAYSIVHFHSHPSVHGGYIAWPLSFICHYWLLSQDEDGPLSRHHDTLHIGLLLLLIGLCSWEAAWWTEHWVHGSGVWSLVVLGAVPALFMTLLCRVWDTPVWPLVGRQRTYLYRALLPVAAYLWLGSIAVNLTSRGNPWPLPYLPLLNPLDLTQAGVFLALAWWFYVLGVQLEIRPFGLPRRSLVIGGGATIFLWLNAMLIRTLHYWYQVPFHLPAMTRSDLVQTSLSIFWTLAAMLVMLWGTRRAIRPVWMAGAGLIGVVIVKLFMFDLANTSTVERIVSFIGVGLLCLAIGYLAPLPARAGEAAGAE
jgi:uncharacterized membrane protein